MNLTPMMGFQELMDLAWFSPQANDSISVLVTSTMVLKEFGRSKELNLTELKLTELY
jgi:hypothetical protein